MLSWIKTNVLGIRPAVQKPTPKKVASGPAGKSAAAATTKKAPANVAGKKLTKAGLEKLTKVQIDELAKAEMGVDLDRRKTKDAMIKEFLTAQKKK